MPDDKTKKKPQDASRINVNQPYENAYWCNKFGCSEEKLKNAVNAVGTSKENVAAYLNKKWIKIMVYHHGTPFY